MATSPENKATEYQQLEASLRDSEVRLRAILDNVVDGVITINESGIVQSFNPAAERIFGYTASEVIGQNVKMLMPEPYHSHHDEYLGNYLRTGKARVIGIGREVVGRRKDGSTFPVDLAVSEVHIGDERLFTGIVRDITERKGAEEQLERMSKVFMDVTDPIVIEDMDGIVVDMNKEAERAYGWTRKELIGKPIKTIVPPERPEQALELLSLCKQGKEVQNVEALRWRKSGERMNILLTLSLLSDDKGKPVAVATIAKDITDRKQAEEALRRSEGRIRTVLENVVDGIITIDKSGIIQSFNPAAVRIFGYSADEVISRNVKMLMPEPYHSQHDGYLGNYLRTGEAKVIGIGREVVGRRKDGSTFPLDLAVSEIRMGEERLFTGIIRDITERKRAQEKLKQTAEELARSNADLQQFAYVASHDLQEPLRMVASYVQLLERRYKGKLDKDADEFIHFAADGAARMQNLIDGLLEYSRVGARGKRLEPTESSGVFDHAVANLKMAIEESGAEVTHGELPTVMADVTQLTQLFQNLIGNALKFRGDKPPKVHVSAEAKEGMWQFSVSDNGIGIEPQYAERIFVIFQRLHGKEEYPGTGIGLSVCKKIVERHGGRIWLESEPGKGSTFYFTLPMAQG